MRCTLVRVVSIALLILAHGINAQIDLVKYDPNLTSTLFTRTDSIKDKVWLDSGLPYYGMPINSNCFITGDVLEDTLLFCDCYKKHDTIMVMVTTPSACCMNHFFIQIVKDKFKAELIYSYDIGPAPMGIHAQRQSLVLRSSDINKLEGYIEFEGKGKYIMKQAHAKLSKKEANQVFKVAAKGYFKCKVEQQR